MPDGTAVANLSLACTDKFKDKSGQMVEQTEWVRISFFGRTAEVCGEYLKKGSQVYVEGSIRTRKYTDKDGVEKYATEIRGDRMQMLGGRESGNPQQQKSAGDYARQTGSEAPPARQPAQPRQAATSNGFDDMDDDITF